MICHNKEMAIKHHGKIMKFRGHAHQIIIKLLAFNSRTLREKGTFSTKQKFKLRRTPIYSQAI